MKHLGINYFCKILPDNYLIYFVLINLVSNVAYIFYWAFTPSLWSISFIISSAFLFGWLESVIVTLVNKPVIKTIIVSLITVLHSLIILVDYFLLVNFHLVCNQDVIDIISETTTEESISFFQTYLNIPTVSIYLLSIILIIAAAYKINKIFKQRGTLSICLIIYMCVVTGVFDVGRSAYGYILYKEGHNGPQYFAPARICYSSLVLKSRVKSISNIAQHNENVVSIINSECPVNVVVIIGESVSKYHCSLYGYSYDTFPLMSKWVKSGNMVVFDDVICTTDSTHGNMKEIFSTGQGNEINYNSLFPVCFKKAGYYTALVDNQYLVGHSVTFLSDETLSKQMFDYRNDKCEKYDGDLILNNTLNKHIPYLIVYHLMGQHYTYSDRYPDTFKIFDKNQYDKKYTDSQREIIAHYDNACLYNDYVINEIINKYKDDDCVIIYFSDHGEEVFDMGDFMGHGSVMSSKDIRYQIDIPFVVWMSDTFKHNHCIQYNKISKAQNVPFQASNVCHMIMDICGIQSSEYRPELSLINDAYDTNQHRIVMSSVDYDNLF